MATRIHRWRSWLGPVMVAGVCIGGVIGGYGQSSAAPAAARVATADTSAAARHSIRLPDPRRLVSGVIGLSTTARDGRQKANVQVPPTVAVAYLDPAYRTPKSQTIPAPSYNLPRHPLAGCHYYEAILYTDLYAVTIRQPNPKKNGVVTSLGRFPNAHVSALAFGSIPVTATLHTHQIRRHGKVVPLTANTITAFSSLPLRKNGGPCDPRWDSGAQEPPLTTVSHGQLAVTISDVRVDKQLVDVGPSCHTVTPLQLNLFGTAGYIVYTGGRLIERYDPAYVDNGGSRYPVHPGSSNLTIPAFTGCRNPHTGENYDRLLTAMVSGPNNTLAVHQSHAVLNGISNKHVTKCLKGQGCVKLPTFVNPPRPGDVVRPRRH